MVFLLFSEATLRCPGGSNPDCKLKCKHCKLFQIAGCTSRLKESVPRKPLPPWRELWGAEVTTKTQYDGNENEIKIAVNIYCCLLSSTALVLFDMIFLSNRQVLWRETFAENIPLFLSLLIMRDRSRHCGE
jgi:hypothetical protein